MRGVRFRALIVLYLFASLAISGTSIFALKTAGIMWFLFGVLSVAPGRAGVESAGSQPDKASVPRDVSHATNAMRSFKGSQV